jgi:4-alpha-glucanotransferase
LPCILYTSIWRKSPVAKTPPILKPHKFKQNALNNLPHVNYEQVMNLKFSIIKELYFLQKDTFLNDTKYFEFFDLNRHWLVPYAAFCYLRDKYKTADFQQWKTHSRFDEDAIQALASPTNKHYDNIALILFYTIPPSSAIKGSNCLCT